MTIADASPYVTYADNSQVHLGHRTLHDAKEFVSDYRAGHPDATIVINYFSGPDATGTRCEYLLPRSQIWKRTNLNVGQAFVLANQESNP